MRVVRLHAYVQGTRAAKKCLVTSDNGGVAKKGWLWLLEVNDARRHMHACKNTHIAIHTNTHKHEHANVIFSTHLQVSPTRLTSQVPPLAQKSLLHTTKE